jgi:phage baseplate assembly protein W
MRSQFGSGIANYSQQPNTADARRQIRQAITAGLGQWEPRIVVDGVDVTTLPSRPTAVRVEIAFRVKRTRAAQRLGLTMEMGA